MDPPSSTPSSSLILNIENKPSFNSNNHPSSSSSSSTFHPSEDNLYLHGGAPHRLMNDEFAGFFHHENHHNDSNNVHINHVGNEATPCINVCLSQYPHGMALPMVLQTDRDMLTTCMMATHEKQLKHEGEVQHHHVNHSSKDGHEHGDANDDEEEEEEEEDFDEDGGDGDGDGDDVGNDEEDEEEYEITHMRTPPWPCETTVTTTSMKAANNATALPYPTVSMVMCSSSNGEQGSSPIACLDCGNQAKKDCVHMRCRTCCKSKWLECPTHIKSTWVPAHKRKHRQSNGHHTMVSVPKKEFLGFHVEDQRGVSHNTTIMTPTTTTTTTSPPTTNHEQFHGEGSDEATACTHSHASASNGTPPHQAPHKPTWLQQEEYRHKRNLPGETREHATFKCIRVTGMNDGMEEYAYQTVVTIGGHVYKGVLYDQGVDKLEAQGVGIAELRLGSRNNGEISSIDLASHLHGTPKSVFMGTRVTVSPK